MRYRLLAIDLDGTLLDRHGRVSRANVEAVRAAQRAGVTVVPCTGRAWREAARRLADVAGLEIGVFATGAAVCAMDTGEAHDLAVLEPSLAERLVAALADEPEAALVLREPALAGHDYLVAGEGTLSPNTQWWFKANAARVRFRRRVTADELRHTLRVGMVGSPERVQRMQTKIANQFGDAVFLHSFTAVDHPRAEEATHVLEIFAAGVDKWRGLEWIARARGIPRDAIAAIGDGINDLAMIEGAACGIAMANAHDSAKLRADHVTADCDENGVARAIEGMIAGRWG